MVAMQYLTTVPTAHPISPHRHKAPRQAMSAVMGQLEDLYARVIPLLQQSHPQEVKSVANEFYAVHGAMGRVKIGLLPTT